MKKIIIISIVLLALPVFAFAAYEEGPKTLGGTDTLIVALSNQVWLDYAAGGTGGDTFVVATYHDKGSRTYMSSSEDANMYYGEATAVSMPSAPAVGTSLGDTQTGFPNTL